MSNKDKNKKEEVNDVKVEASENAPINDKKEKKDKLQKEIDRKEEVILKLKDELESFKDKYYRAIADMDNQRKLHDKEYHNALKYGGQDLAEKLIPSFEMFSMVIENVDNLPPEVIPYVQGFTMIYKQMIQAFESEGISEVKAVVGDKFDHTIHSAMETEKVDDKEKDGIITKVVRKGYKIHDRLIKPAAVVVGKYEEVKEDNDENKSEANA